MKKNLTRRAFVAASAVGAASFVVPAATAAATPEEVPILGPGPHNQAYSATLGNPVLNPGLGMLSREFASVLPNLESAVQWAIGIANDNSHGYDQTNRWGPDYDCSSFVIQAFENAGFGVMEAGATSTGNMRSCFAAVGFQVLTDFSNLQRGDVLLNDADHTALYIGNGQLVEASINEFGEVSGGQTGDQTGTEIYVHGYYNYPWNCVLRWESSMDPTRIWIRQGDGAATEKWRLLKVDDRHYLIQSVANDKFLTLEASNTTPGTKFRMWQHNSTDSQLFWLEPWSYDTYKWVFIRSKLDIGMVLGIENGSHQDGSYTQLENLSDVDSQRWSIVPCHTPNEERYYIVNLNSGKFLECANA